MGKMVACALILMAMLLGVALLGFIQIIRAWAIFSDKETLRYGIIQ